MDEAAPGDPREQSPAPSGRTYVGLLENITANSMDEDYAHVSQRRAPGEKRSRRPGTPTLVIVAVFGLLVATAGVQTARHQPAEQRSQQSLESQVRDRRTGLDGARAELAALQRSVTRTQQQALQTSASGRALRAQLDRLGLVAGSVPATGPGVRIVVDDGPPTRGGRQAVLDTDLQILANGLWASGAEAVSINGQRLTNLSAIRVAGDAITVNLRSLKPPYTVDAIGDPNQLAARFLDSDAGTWWLNLKTVYKLRFDMNTEDSLNVPAAPPLTLRHAKPAGNHQ
jgi:uncharacterized protein YlxW (UPF0749 family)